MGRLVPNLASYSGSRVWIPFTGVSELSCAEGQHAGDLDDGVDLVAALSAEFTNGQNGEGGAVVARSFCGSHLHGLLVNHHLCLQVTGRTDTSEGEEAHNSAQAQGLEPNLEIALSAPLSDSPTTTLPSTTLSMPSLRRRHSLYHAIPTRKPPAT